MSVPETLPPAPTGARAGAVAVVGLAALALLALLYAHRFLDLYDTWTTNDNYSHGFLIPVVSAVLAWGVLRRQGWTGEGSPRAGLFWVATGCVLHLWADVIWWPPFDFLALAVLLYGLAVLAGGRRWAQGFLFPILFLFFMFPLPPALLNYAAIWLQGVVSTAATAVLQLFIPAHQRGNSIYLPGHPVEVGEACSGLRQVVAFAALTLLIAYLSRRRLPFRLGLVVAGLPVAIAANLLRVLLMAALVLNYGPEAISDKKALFPGISYHTAWGMLTMAGGLVLLLAIAWWLGRVFPSSDKPEAPARALLLAPRAGALSPYGTAVLCLAVATTAHFTLEAHLSIVDETAANWTYLQKPLHADGDRGFPASLGEWSGPASPSPATLSARAAEDYFRAADDKVIRRYVRRDEEGQPIRPSCQLWMVHFRNGLDRQHHPLICYQVAGYLEEPAGRQDVTMEGPGGAAQRFCFTRGDAASYPIYVYYWHYTLPPPDAPGWSWLQGLHARCTVSPSLTVQVFTDAQTPEELEQAAAFVRLADGQLQAYLPSGARRGSDTLPIVVRR
jgi:exosortase